MYHAHHLKTNSSSAVNTIRPGKDSNVKTKMAVGVPMSLPPGSSANPIRKDAQTMLVVNVIICTINMVSSSTSIVVTSLNFRKNRSAYRKAPVPLVRTDGIVTGSVFMICLSCPLRESVRMRCNALCDSSKDNQARLRSPIPRKRTHTMLV